ncbi:MAG: type 4b pilus protein PilO2 [Methylophilaceae bacterium]|nr:type 4b pilus protein PilO2 [Methylophilaceae bacterium]
MKVVIGGVNFVLGMKWYTFSAQPTKAELDALDNGAQWYSLRQDEVIQVGLMRDIGKIGGRLFSLAGTIASSNSGAWHGIFNIDENLYWYIAVIDGAVLPHGDVVGSKANVEAFKAQHAQLAASWKVVADEEHAVSNLLAKADIHVPVKRFKSTSKAWWILLGMILLGVIGSGFYWWWERQLALEAQTNSAEKTRLEKERVLKKQQLENEKPTSLVLFSLPSDWLKACGGLILQQPLSLYGWTLEQVICDKTNVVLAWARADGAKIDPRPEGELSVDGEKVTETLRLPEIVQQLFKLESLSFQKTRIALQAWAQAIGGTVSFSSAPIVIGTAPKFFTFKTEVPISPFNLSFDQIEGMKLTKLKSTANGWTLEGAFYGQ